MQLINEDDVAKFHEPLLTMLKIAGTAENKKVEFEDTITVGDDNTVANIKCKKNKDKIKFEIKFYK